MLDQKANGGIAGMHDIRATVAALTVCNEDGSLIFSLADIEALGRKSSTVLDRIADVAQRLNPWLNAQDEVAGKKSS